MKKHIIIVGGGFAGMACAEKLAGNPAIHVTLIDKNNYHKFTPLLYQVATSALSIDDVAISFRQYFKEKSNMGIKMAKVVSVDPNTLTVKTEEGGSYQGDILVLAAGAVVNFFGTPGAEQNTFPLYNLTDAERLRSRILAVFEAADRDERLIDQGALNFVIVGAGPTGTEVAGAIADMLNVALPKEFSDLALNKAKIYLVDHSKSVLGAFSKESQKYATEILTKRGLQLKLGLLVKTVALDHVVLSNGEKISTRTVIWAGGLEAETLAGSTGLPQGHGKRINVLSDLTIEGYPNIYAIGDFANISGPDGSPLPQLASVAKQSGKWAGKNILNQLTGKPRIHFKYDDKGIMAMIGRNAAIAEVGKKRRELKGFLAYLAWLGVHVALLSTIRQRIGAFFTWTWDYFGKTRALQILDRSNAARINWNKETSNQS